ncbi:MAG: nitroreductase family protein [Propionibacteriaceae bacterium]|nr:nitroreductase family protein [Propionibacteriaceae bacterium]
MSDQTASEHGSSDAESLARVIRRRHMVRRFADRPVPTKLLDEVVAYAVRAPSAGFTQAISLVKLTGRRVRRFWALTTLPRGANQHQLVTEPQNAWLAGMITAPVLVLVWTDRDAYVRRYAEPDKGWGTDPDAQPWSAPYWWVDAGMAVQNVLLGASANGLGACFFGVPVDRADTVREAFGVPADQLSVGVIALGWPTDEAPIGSVQRRPRRPATELIHEEAW